MLKLYLDVDDTLADFRRQNMARGCPPWEGTWYTQPPSTWTPEQKEIDRITCANMMHREFWSEMPVAAGCFEIIAAAAARAEVYLLTALPRMLPEETQRMISFEKFAWCERVLHFPSARVIVCPRADKIKYACKGFMDEDGCWHPRANPNVLVDDAVQNCEEWSAAGGHAIHHTGFESTLAAIKAL